MPTTTAYRVFETAHAAAEAVRLLNHLITGSPLGVDELDRVLDQLELVGYRTSHALHQLGHTLDSDGWTRLEQAASVAVLLGHEIGQARTSLAARPAPAESAESVR
jgi:hypothetical protein